MSKKHWKFNKKDIERLLDARAGLGRDALSCASETNNVILCWAATAQRSNDQACRAYEEALQRCEVSMGNRGPQKQRAEIKRTLIFQLLRYANKRNKNAIFGGLKDKPVH